jgi:hypothetical protein
VAQVVWWGSLAIPTYAGCRRAQACQGRALKGGREDAASLDRPCARAAARFGGRDGRMLAARVEPKNGPGGGWRSRGGSDLRYCACVSCSPTETRPLCRITDCAASYEVVGSPLIQICPPISRVTTDKRIMPAHSVTLQNRAQVGSFSLAPRQHHDPHGRMATASRASIQRIR